MALKALTLTAALGAVLSACSPKAVDLPVTELPRRPLAATVPCPDLSADEEAACLKSSAGAREVCRKAQHNSRVCRSNQDFTKRLYQYRDGR